MQDRIIISAKIVGESHILRQPFSLTVTIEVDLWVPSLTIFYILQQV
jgi:hypothetical protein